MTSRIFTVPQRHAQLSSCTSSTRIIHVHKRENFSSTLAAALPYAAHSQAATCSRRPTSLRARISSRPALPSPSSSFFFLDPFWPRSTPSSRGSRRLRQHADRHPLAPHNRPQPATDPIFWDAPQDLRALQLVKRSTFSSRTINDCNLNMDIDMHHSHFNGPRHSTRLADIHSISHPSASCPRNAVAPHVVSLSPSHRRNRLAKNYSTQPGVV